LWFHSVIWPAMLFSAGIKPPKNAFAHGWLTIEGEKISKTTGNVINVDELVSIAGLDSARYFLMRSVPFGEDGDFSRTALVDRHNNELADKLGNLVSRVSALAEKYGLEKTQNNLVKKFKEKEIENYLENCEFDKALNEIFAFIDSCNEHVQEKKPWETHDKKVLYELVESIRKINFYLSPFVPETSEKIARTFKTDKIKKAEILFRKIDIKA